MLSALSALVSSGEIAKASLESVEGAKVSVVGHFNPTTLKLTRSVVWNALDNQGDTWPVLQFGKGNLDELSFTLLFDETEGNDKLAKALAGGKVPNPFALPTGALPGTGGVMAAIALQKAASLAVGKLPKNKNSVTDRLKILQSLTAATVKDSQKGVKEAKRPPLVRFSWGDFVFDGVVKQFVADVLLFDEKGTPKRASVQVTLNGIAFGKSLTVKKMLDPEAMDAAAKKAEEDAKKAETKLG